MADTKLAKVGITVKESWKDDISYEVLDYTLWRVQDGGDGCGYIAKRANIGVVPNSDDSVWIKATQAGQSIYDLAVKYGHFEGTEEEFEAEYQAVLQAARDAASETSATNTEIQEAEELRKTAENTRVEAETARQTAESGRQTAETARQTAETARNTAETQRGDNETTRQSQETARESAEQTRQTNESTRQSNETARESAEQERTADFEGLKTDMQTAIQQADAATAAAGEINRTVQQNETARQQAESGRATAETQRQTAETQRGTNEQTRQTQETARQTAEQTRNTQEGTRQTQETARQTAEGNRASAESQRVSNETARQTAETARESQSTSDHERAEADHAIAENDHSTLDEKISHKADIDGSYDGMAVGIARNLEGRTDVTDSFFARTTGGDAEVANGTAQLNEVKGKSQVWNQLVAPNSASGGTSKNVTYSISAGKLLLQTTADGVDGIGTVNIAASWIRDSTLGIKQITGHLYYSPKTLPTGFWFSANAYTGGISLCSGTITTGLAGGFENGQAWSLRATGGTKVLNQIECPIILFDLTAIFGAGNEPATVEEFEAWLAENIGEQAYYPYNEGEVLNNRMTGVESIGFNLLDPATGKADILGAYSDVYGNYYGITGTHGTLTFTDKFGNEETITPDEDGKFLLEKAGTLSVADAGEDCAVFLWWDGTQTEYKPYEKNVGQLDVTHIYGKLNGEGDYVRVWPTGMPGIGDIKDSLKVVDGQVVAERKVGEVDMGTLNWTRSGGSGDKPYVLQTTGLTDYKYTGAITGRIATLCPKYAVKWTSANNSGNDLDDKTFKLFQSYSSILGRYVMVRDDSYTDAATFKTAMSGVLLYYELATPQVFTDLIYRDSEDFADGTPVTLPVNYKVDNWGIERVVPQNTEEAVVTTSPELTMRYSIDAVETMNTHSDQIEDLYEKNEELDQRKPEKYGEYPDMAVGSAKTLAGQDTKVEDFVFKAIDCADGLAKINSARGKSLVMNQLIKVVEGTLTNQGVTITKYSNGELNFSGLATSSGGRARALTASTINTIAGHKYYRKTNKRGDGRLDFYEQYQDGTYRSFSYNSGKIVVETESKTGGYIGGNLFVDENYNTSVSILMVDLTLMFGAGNEPATVEEFEAMFPLPYYDYNEGEIISNKTEEVKVTGFNQWDGTYRNTGSYINASGFTSTSTNYNITNFIECVGGRTYYINGKSGSNPSVCFYKNKDTNSFISGINYGTIESDSVFTAPINARYMLLSVPVANKDIFCINLSDPSRNGEYEPYKTNTIELNLPTLTGKLNGEGESVVVFPDGLKSVDLAYDEIVGNKAIKRIVVYDKNIRFNSYTDSTKNYVLGEANGYYVGSQSRVNVISSGEYEATSRDNFLNYDKAICVNSGGTIIIRDTRFTGVLATDRELLGDALFAVALKTPEEYILDAPLPDTFQAYKGGTIKQLPENGSVPVTAPCILTATYAIDAVSALVGLPRNYVSKESLQAMLNAMQSAGIIASYTMTYNENTGKYDFTFVAPTNS